MSASSDTRPVRPPVATVDTRPLLVFALVAVPTGWVFLSAYQLLGLPDAPFVLLTLALGLVLPAVLLLRRDPTASVVALLRDTLRPARPGWLMLPALLALPVGTWVPAAALDGAEPLDADVVLGFAVALLSSLLVVNLWEELAWTGFFQRRAIGRWGVVGGSLVTAALFAAIHLPLALADADGPGDVLRGLAALVGAGIGMRLLVAAFDQWSGRSLLAVAALHASFNATAEVVDPDLDWIRYLVTVTSGIFAVALLRRPAVAQPSPIPEEHHR